MFVLAIAALVGGVVVIGPLAAEVDAPSVLLFALAGPWVINCVFALRYNTICASAFLEKRI